MIMKFEDVLRLPLAQKVLGHHLSLDEDSLPFAVGVVSRIDFLLRNPENVIPLAEIGNAAHNAFLQSNVTGPPLSFDSAETIIPKAYQASSTSLSELRQQLLQDLSIDGEAIYQLVPNIELFWLAKRVLSHDAIADLKDGRRQRARTNFVHQRLLFEESETLRELIYSDLDVVDQSLLGQDANAKTRADFLIERAAIHIYYGHDGEAREDLGRAAKLRPFVFALTGRLGKRTKFQQFDLSQLVVLARSAESTSADRTQNGETENVTAIMDQSKPDSLALNDDTLLESISFTKKEKTSSLPSVEDEASLPTTLASLDPADQPLLSAEDSIILLSIASSITNKSPSDGLTREETLPYAVRVLEGGSSNWQIYTQALLLRSRIEGYNSRTAERGLLQLQALVDQVIADTTAANADGSSETPATFLPRPKATESAPAEERLKYIYPLAPPFRWTLEAELAQRWVSMGGLRSALDIYERLQMWPEVALCFAATDQEQKAIYTVRKLLFQPSPSGITDDFSGPEIPTLPPDAPRLFCILGDLEPTLSIQHYTRSWQISNNRYARAQRSLGRLYTKQKSYTLAAESYKLALHITRLNASTWFALGCVQLELEDYAGAASSFTQMIQIEEDDAEGWSNLAVALLKLPIDTDTTKPPHSSSPTTSPEDPYFTTPPIKPWHNRFAALRALQRATALKPTDARLWDNLLTVSISLPPSITPWPLILQSQSHLLTLRASESAIDIPILTRLVTHVVTTTPSPTSQNSLASQVTSMMHTQITPLITTQPDLWYQVSRLARWRHRPAAALEAEEKGWRTATARPGAYETHDAFARMVQATLRLVDAYRELGPLGREEGATTTTTAGGGDQWSTGAGAAEQVSTEAGSAVAVPVAKDWPFKARSAVRSVTGKGRSGGFEDSEAMRRLVEVGEGLKGTTSQSQ